ncbi:MAG: methyltransferase domain-containing protein [Candidatus Dormibacteraeota bacterium]|nr:methyltransferase domain-containing protein [Candidatus Dormibacteraeota bacterium]
MAVRPDTPEYALDLSEAERMRYREMAKRARVQEGERWQRYGVVPGARIADVGCGPGAVLVALAEVVGPNGSVTGVEPNATARAAALEEIRSSGLDNATVVAGDGTATTLDPGTYDVVMIRHVLFHVGDAVQAVLAHAVTLLRPGGHVYTVDVDLTGRRLSVSDADFDEQAQRYVEFQRDRGNNVDIGPKLGPLLAEAGLELRDHEGTIQKVPGEFLRLGGPMVAARHEMLAAGAITEDDARRYDAATQRVAATPNAALFVSQYIAVGRKG